jgi:hypothetical protein
MSLHQSFARAVVGTASVLPGPAIGIPSVSGAPWPYVEVVFTQCTFEPSGVGATREAFNNASRPQARTSSELLHENCPRCRSTVQATGIHASPNASPNASQTEG